MTSDGNGRPWLEDSSAAKNATILSGEDAVNSSATFSDLPYYDSWDSQTQTNNNINNEITGPSFMSAPTTAVPTLEVPQEIRSSEPNQFLYSIPQNPSYLPPFIYPDPVTNSAPMAPYGEYNSQLPQLNRSPAVTSNPQYGSNSHLNGVLCGVPSFQLPHQLPAGYPVDGYLHNISNGQYIGQIMAPLQGPQTHPTITAANTRTMTAPPALIAPLAPVSSSSGPLVTDPSNLLIAGPSIPLIAGSSLPPVAGASITPGAGLSVPPIAGPSGSAAAPPAARKRRKRAVSKSESEGGSDFWYNEENQVTPAILSSKRKDKRKRNHRVQAHRFYTTKFEQPGSWGYRWEAKLGRYSEALFSYTEHGQLHAGINFDQQRLKFYIENCPRQLRIWVQNHPAQVKHRMDQDKDQFCRYAGCPSKGKGIRAGWHRVSFDEYYVETSDGRKDPFKVAGVMHLWCFEQITDPHLLYRKEILAPDTRDFPQEEKNPMSLARDSDKHMVSGAFKPWIRRNDEIRKANKDKNEGTLVFPRPHNESLAYQLVTYHLSHQTRARQETRAKRNAVRPPSERKTLDVHLGDLSVFASRTSDEFKRKQRERLRKKSRAIEEQKEGPAQDYPPEAVHQVLRVYNQDNQIVSYVHQNPSSVQQQAHNTGQQQTLNTSQQHTSNTDQQQPVNNAQQQDIYYVQQQASNASQQRAIDYMQQQPVNDTQQQAIIYMHPQPVNDIQQRDIKYTQHQPVNDIQQQPINYMQHQPVNDIQQQPINYTQQQPVDSVPQQSANDNPQRPPNDVVQQIIQDIQSSTSQNAAILSQSYYSNASISESTAPLPTSEGQLTHNSVVPEDYIEEAAPVNLYQPQLQPLPQDAALVHQAFDPLDFTRSVIAAPNRNTTPVQQVEIDPTLFSNTNNSAPQNNKYGSDEQTDDLEAPASLGSVLGNLATIQDTIAIEGDTEPARNPVEANAGEQQQPSSSKKRPRNDVEDDADNEHDTKPNKRAHYDAEKHLEDGSLFGSPA